ncbi:hypothetical protein GWI33_012632 [Rhynchophorus ferrugineus]|uniref:EB domain-containing protein n=1 Tax=Rhynchophorus ferrugineus TaxID=354439 RepID=A0A834MCA2_RHYFE|nr:hypothetical protein GWI33_012632 [Rhynchophorus ferrugineus]
MKCYDFMLFIFLCILSLNVVFTEGRQDLNGPCRTVTECKTVVYYCARNATCQCLPGYIPNDKFTKCLGLVGSKCIYDSQCIEGAYCTSQERRELCRCREEDDYFVSEDGQTCTSAAVWNINNKAVLSR